MRCVLFGTDTERYCNAMRILLYYHTGSKNHGCEAIVRTICKLFAQEEIILYSFQPQTDRIFGLEQLVTIKGCMVRKKTYSIMERILIRLHIQQEGAECFQEMLNEKVDWAFSIGGDNYCYPGQPEELAYLNREFHKRNIKTALFGCSINPDIVRKKTVRKDLSRYNLIIARESMTYDVMKQCGLHNCFLYPDSAFILPKGRVDLKENIKEYIGINISPLVIKGGKDDHIVYENYITLIDYIIENTAYDIILLPHVTVEWDNDYTVLDKIYEKYEATNRILEIDEHNCMEIKGYIARCKMVVCARTHVSIAAYSMGIPTLVIGYSIKSKGIAKDLFGEYEHYVISVAALENVDDLLSAFRWLEEKQDNVRKKLVEKQLEYQNSLDKLPALFYGEIE